MRRLPDDSQLAVDLIDRQMRRGHRAEAAAAFDRAIVRFAGNRSALQSLAMLASRSGEDRRALKTWQRLHKLDPGNEIVIIGLGESQFQVGQKTEARATWAALRERVRPPVRGHLRLAEVLLEHDLGADAVAEAKRAQALEPKSIEPHRLLAQIFEHMKKVERRGRRVEHGARPRGPQASGQRATRRAQARGACPPARPSDASGTRPHGRADPAAARGCAPSSRRSRGRPFPRRGAAAHRRLGGRDSDAQGAAGAGRRDGAQTALRATSPSRPGSRSSTCSSAPASSTRRCRASTKSRGWRRDARARHICRSPTSRSRATTSSALCPTRRRLPPAPMRRRLRASVNLQARAGADDLAIATYRAAVARDANPAATLALARLLVRRGDEQEAADALGGLLRTSHDDDAITEAGRLAIELAELRGPVAGARIRGWRKRWRPGRIRPPAASCSRRCSSGCCHRCTAIPRQTARAPRSAGAFCVRCWRSSRRPNRRRTARSSI